MLSRLILAFILSIASFCTYASSNEELTRGLLRLNSEASTFDAPILTTDVQYEIAGLSARVKVTQTFRNNSPDWVEGVYLFPLPEKSAVDTLLMKVGERTIVGEIKEKHLAKKIYKKAKASGKKAALIEQHRPNVFTSSVANIAPNEKIEISIEFQQDLEFQKDGTLSIRFPMTMTERYTPKSTIVETFSSLKGGMQSSPSQKRVDDVFDNINLAQKASSEPGNEVDIRVKLNSGMPLDLLESTSHPVLKNEASLNVFNITLDGESFKADRDFILRWKPQAGSAPRIGFFSETIENENYVSLMLMPPKIESNQQVLDREVIFVIDTSGSMAGESIEQAKRALAFALTQLKTSDKFNLIEFNSRTTSLYWDTQYASDANLSRALSFIHGLRADGGTEMLPAMERALTALNNSSDNNAAVKQVVFLTDGAISNESQLFQIIKEQLGDTRLFTVGIGSAPNTFFMRRAAKFGRGSATFISNLRQSESKMRELFKAISQPMLTHINIEWPDSSEVEMWPTKVPDLFLGEPLWIKAKLNDMKAQVKISGRLPNGLWQTSVDLASSQSQKGIAKLWAREKIASIMDESNHSHLDDASRQQIIDTALKHQLVSRFTSLVAVDKTPSRIAERLVKRPVSQVKPKGSASSSVNFPKTAVQYPVPMNIAMGILILSIFIWVGLIVRERFIK